MTERRIVRTYMALAALYTLAASLIWSVNTLFLLDAGLSLSEVFIANALFSVGMVLFEIPTGVVADTLGRRVSYLLSVAILAVTTVLYLVAAAAESGVVVFGAVSILMGLGFTFFSGALESWLVDALNTVEGNHPLDHVFARGSQVNGTAMFFGTIAGGLLGQIDLAVPFYARSGLLVVVFMLAASLMHEIGFEPQKLTPSEVPAAMKVQARAGITHGWSLPGLRLLMLSAAVRGVFFGWAFYASQPYFLELLETDAVWVVGIITACLSLAMIVGNQIVEILSRRCGRRTTLLIWGSTASSAAAVVMGATSSFAVAVGCLMVIAMAMGVISPVRQAFVHGMTDSEHRATVVSFDAMVSSIGGAGGQIGLGRVSDRSSLSSGYVVGGLFTVLALPILWALRSKAEPSDVIVGNAAVDGTCPSGLPTATGVESHPVPVLTGADSE